MKICKSIYLFVYRSSLRRNILVCLDTGKDEAASVPQQAVRPNGPPSQKRNTTCDVPISMKLSTSAPLHSMSFVKMGLSRSLVLVAVLVLHVHAATILRQTPRSLTPYHFPTPLAHHKRTTNLSDDPIRQEFNFTAGKPGREVLFESPE